MEIAMMLVFIVGWVISLCSIRIRRFMMALIGFLNGLIIGVIAFILFQIAQIATYEALYSGRTGDNETQIIVCILIGLGVALILAYLSFKYYKLMLLLNTILFWIELFFILFFLNGFLKIAAVLIAILVFIAILWIYCTYLWTDLFFILYTSLIGAIISTNSVAYWSRNSSNIEFLIFYLLFQTVIGSVVQYRSLKKIKGMNTEQERVRDTHSIALNDAAQKVLSLFSLTFQAIIEGGEELFSDFKSILVENQWYLVIPLFVHLVDPLILLFFYFTGVYSYIYSTYPLFFHIRYLIIEALMAFSIGQYIYLVFQKKWGTCLFMVLLQIVGIILIRPIFYHRIFREIGMTLLGFILLIFIYNLSSKSSFSKLMILSGLAGFLNAMLPMYTMVDFDLMFYYSDLLSHMNQIETWLSLILTLLGTFLCIHFDSLSPSFKRKKFLLRS